MNEHHYGVVVGINRYPGFKPLKYARKDAEDFYKWLIDHEGGDVPEENVGLITVPDDNVPDGISLENARPIRKEIEAALDKFRLHCKERIKNEPADWKKTRLYFFASGHGISPNLRDAALLMADANNTHYGRNFSCSRYIESFEREQPFRELVFFADCCRERVNNTNFNGPEWTEEPRQNGPLLIVRGYAARFGELAFEQTQEINDPDQLRGYFTKALLEGLKGSKGAINAETNEIDSVTLSTFVTQRVKALTSHLQQPQTPYFVPEPSDPRIVFKRVVPAAHAEQVPTYETCIFFPPSFTGRVKLVYSDRQRKEYHDVGDTTWMVHLPDGNYQVILENGSSPFQGQGFFSVDGGKKDVHL